MLFLVTALVSCNQGPTLETYFVDSEQNSGFLTFDVPASVVNVENMTLTEKQEEAYESIDKLNVLVFQLNDENKDAYDLELDNVKAILKHAKYEELMRGSTEDGRFAIKFIGEEDNIDELILFGSADNKGFVVARVLGDDMNLNKIMSLSDVLDKADIEGTQLDALTDFFK